MHTIEISTMERLCSKAEAKTLNRSFVSPRSLDDQQNLQVILTRRGRNVSTRMWRIANDGIFSMMTKSFRGGLYSAHVEKERSTFLCARTVEGHDNRHLPPRPWIFLAWPNDRIRMA